MKQAFSFAIRASVVVLIAGCSGPGDENNGGVPIGESQCERDEANAPETAAPLTLGESVQGYICPVEDEDWFRLTVSPGNKLFSVGLELSAALSPVEPSYRCER